MLKKSYPGRHSPAFAFIDETVKLRFRQFLLPEKGLHGVWVLADLWYDKNGYIMCERGETEFDGFKDFFGGFADKPVFGLRVFGSVLYFEVDLPAYIIGEIEKRPGGRIQVIKTKLGSSFVD